jgi:hypothetical protein
VGIAVITAQFGGYDLPPIAPPDGAGVDEWVYVTDGEPADGWTTIVEPADGDPRMQAKRPKCLPWEYTDAEASLWLDASLVPTAAVGHNFDGERMAQHAHLERDDFLDEAHASVPNVKYDRYRVLEQADTYLADGMPRHWGLYCTGLIARPHNPAIRQHGELWLEEIHKWSTQDQVSHPYCCWKLGIRPKTLPRHVLQNKTVWYRLHAPEAAGEPLR